MFIFWSIIYSKYIFNRLNNIIYHIHVSIEIFIHI